ncbi:hypothetical protein P280DRAFT_467457 [Massarina eburnea CBS 473.64]|uniref:Uncharacterized protein n=1 Tax=Massarina eburnea CBS 473.64 TaxID=1395130 RepID=A0A6A6S879_9PLEO|nr:hypothetical protein P280DRAFT_467457 [Massarina eburnea CBS 473.64]
MSTRKGFFPVSSLRQHHLRYNTPPGPILSLAHRPHFRSDLSVPFPALPSALPPKPAPILTNTILNPFYPSNSASPPVRFSYCKCSSVRARPPLWVTEHRAELF